MRDERRQSSEEVLLLLRQEEGLRHNQLRRREIKFARQPLTTATAVQLPAMISLARLRYDGRQGSHRRSLLPPPAARALFLRPARTPKRRCCFQLSAAGPWKRRRGGNLKRWKANWNGLPSSSAESHQVSQHETFA